jgi:hypothetical protein
MTGEITLRGRVLPIGGLKEKVLAAHRAGIDTVIMPEENRKDIENIPGNIQSAIRFVPVSGMDEVLGAALLKAARPRVLPTYSDGCAMDAPGRDAGRDRGRDIGRDIGRDVGGGYAIDDIADEAPDMKEPHIKV